jgi:hypothetical protein
MANQIHNWLDDFLEGGFTSAVEPEDNGQAEYFVIPNAKNPKLLFPKGLSKKGLSRAFDLYPVFTPKHQVKKTIITAMYKCQSLLPAAYHMSIGGKAFAKTLYQQISEHPNQAKKIACCSMRTGSEGKGKKLIFQFLDDQNNIVSYIKLGDRKHRGKWLDNEVEKLNYLNTHTNDLLTIPEVIGYKTTATSSALEITPIQSFKYQPQVAYKHLASVLSKLVLRTKQVSSYDIHKQESLLQEHLGKTTLSSFIFKHLEQVQQNNPIWALSHRDLPAWNVLSNDQGQLAILDWEFGQHGHNPFQDLFHYHIHTQIHNSGQQAEKIVSDFLNNTSMRRIVFQFAKEIGLKHTPIIYSLFIQYLWDWYQLERDNAQDDQQGKQYLNILKYLKKYENRYQYLI